MALLGLKQMKVWLVVLLSLGIAGCTSDLPQQISPIAASLTPQVRPYKTSTPSPTPESRIDLTPVPITPAPTATPFTHQVAKDETMLGIAFKYGIKVEDLMAANPTVDPRMMSVDTILIIPLPVGEVEPMVTVTPLPLFLGSPQCFSSLDENLICLVDVRNTLPQAVENISVWLGISDQDQLLTSQVIFPALNRLSAGERLTLLAHFSGSFSVELEPRAELLTALPVGEQDSRYLEAEVQVKQVAFNSNASQADISAQVTWQTGQPIPGTVWVVAAAYDAGGNPVGIRKLETRPACLPNDSEIPCTSLDVDIVVYSLGPKIHSVEILVEARP